MPKTLVTPQRLTFSVTVAVLPNVSVNWTQDTILEALNAYAPLRAVSDAKHTKVTRQKRKAKS